MTDDFCLLKYAKLMMLLGQQPHKWNTSASRFMHILLNSSVSDFVTFEMKEFFCQEELQNEGEYIKTRIGVMILKTIKIIKNKIKESITY